MKVSELIESLKKLEQDKEIGVYEEKGIKEIEIEEVKKDNYLELLTKDIYIKKIYQYHYYLI